MLTCVSLCVRACVSSTLEKAEHLLFRGHRGTLKSSANEQNQNADRKRIEILTAKDKRLVGFAGWIKQASKSRRRPVVCVCQEGVSS